MVSCPCFTLSASSPSLHCTFFVIFLVLWLFDRNGSPFLRRLRHGSSAGGYRVCSISEPFHNVTAIDLDVPRQATTRKTRANTYFRARRDGRPNGTLTFRRSSTTPGQASQPAASSENAFAASTIDSSAIPQTPGAASYDPTPSQYQKDSILNLYRNGAADSDPSSVIEPGWTPGHTNGNAMRGWGKSNNNHNSQDPSACWNARGDSHPVGVNGMTDDEEKVRRHDGLANPGHGTDKTYRFLRPMLTLL